LNWVIIGLFLIAIWALAVASWREYLRAYQLNDSRWRTACRHLGMLLVGKYIPGGIFGFMMRIYDQPKEQRQRLLWASLADQSCGVAMPVIMGICMMVIESQRNGLWSIALLPIPILAAMGIRALHRIVRHLPLASRYTPPLNAPSTGALCFATSMQLFQVIAWSGLVAIVAQQLYGLDIHAACGLAGAYLLAVAAGMLIVFLPSGIGAREAALVTLSAPWLELSQAIYLAALLRVLSSILDILAGAISAAISPRKEEHEQST